MKHPMIFMLALCLLNSGCVSQEMIPTWAMTNLDERTQADGSVLIRDSNRNWNILKSAIEDEAKREAQDLPPPWKISSWTEFWHTTIVKMSANQEHPEKYFALVLQTRRRFELPDLPRDVLEP
ncbi:MAG: hypothetical protein ABSF76_05590 [Opitutaceae bacterium]|jgi:hypothetical protein